MSSDKRGYFFVYAISTGAFVLAAGCGGETRDTGSNVQPDQSASQRVELAALAADSEIVERGRRLFSSCALCHSVEPDLQSPAGPHLDDIINREVGSVTDYPYTEALKTAGGKWTVDRLDGFLENPQTAIPGNGMAFAGIANPEDRQAIISYLASLSLD